MNPLQKLKTQFLQYLEIEKNRSLLTIRNYDGYLSRFLAFAQEHGVSAPQGLNSDLVRSFRLWLNRQHTKTGKDLKMVTQNYYVIALRSFLKYLAKQDIKTLAAEKLELPKIPMRQVEFLENDDLRKLLAAPNKETEELASLRGRAILELLFSTGLRVQELVNLKRSEINLKKDSFPIRGKGNKLRIVFLSLRAKQALDAYLKKRQDNSPALFIKHNKNLKILDQSPLTARSIQRLIKKYAVLAGVSTKITPHTLRHTMATDLLTAGADLRSVQELLGHSSIVTTQVYTHITNKRLQEIHQKYHGKSIST